jgi:transcriptional regulator with XRE-family HTH domain
MPSPYVRRHRLAAEIRKIRESRGLTTAELGKLVYQSRTKITRLETAQLRPNLADVVTILQALGIEGRKYDTLFALALEAAKKGWWDRYGVAMGPRQKLYADLESGAETIRSYNQTAMPAILQSPEFIEALVDLDRRQGPLTYRPERMAEARTQRQKQLLRKGGPSYETVLDECIIRRLDVPASAMAVQVRHLMSVVTNEERITVRVLPYDATVAGGFLPKSSFYLFTFPDHGDPPLAVLDTVTADLVLTQESEVEQYSEMFKRLRKAALTPDQSLAYLNRVADSLTGEAGSST